jgi:hypothetical protein
MRLTRRHADCNDGTCPTIIETDDPELIVIQGTTLTDPEALADLGPIPDHEQVVLFPRAQLTRYVTKETIGRDSATNPDDRAAG